MHEPLPSHETETPPNPGWQPIETAPKEPSTNEWGNGGPYILLAIPFDPPATCQGWWCHKTNCWRYKGDDGPEDIQPTKWMPLPAAPKAGEPEGE